MKTGRISCTCSSWELHYPEKIEEKGTTKGTWILLQFFHAFSHVFTDWCFPRSEKFDANLGGSDPGSFFRPSNKGFNMFQWGL